MDDASRRVLSLKIKDIKTKASKEIVRINLMTFVELHMHMNCQKLTHDVLIDYSDH